MLDTKYLQCLVFAISEWTRCVLAMLGTRRINGMLGVRGCVFASEPTRSVWCLVLCTCDAWCCVLAMLGVCSSAQMFAAARMFAVVKTHLQSPVKDRRDRRDRRLGGGRITCVLVYVSTSVADLGWILMDFIVISIDSNGFGLDSNKCSLASGECGVDVSRSEQLWGSHVKSDCLSSFGVAIWNLMGGVVLG